MKLANPIRQPILWSLLLCTLLSGCGIRIQGIEIGRLVDATQKVPDMFEHNEQNEIELGANTAKTLLSFHPIYHNEALHSYLNQVGYWLAQHSPRPELPWHFILLEDPSFQAMAAPGGYIFVTTGLLKSLHSEAELATILAHEMAHVIEKHYLIALNKSSRIGFAADLAVLATQTYKASTSKPNDVDNPKVTTQFDRAVLKLYNNGLEREDEFKADRMGVMLATRAGYDPYAFISVLQTIDSRQRRNDRDMLKLTRTHPSAYDRMNHLETIMFDIELYAQNTRTLEQRYRAETSVLFGTSLEDRH